MFIKRNRKRDAGVSIDIAADIFPKLAGLDPGIQGAILAELTSLWLAGHPAEMREEIFQMHIEVTRKLVDVNAKIIRGEE